MNKYFTVLILTIIIGLGFLVRFYELGRAPAGLYIDEAGQGYSAYSILQTGKDEFGKPWPAVFRSFNDFKTPVYIYLITPLIPIFGLTPFTVRFPSFFFSVLTFPLLFFLIKRSAPKPLAEYMAILSTLLLAISPWHILFGRTNFECNVALFFFLLGIYLFIIGVEKKIYLTLSLVVFALSIPAYHSERLISPLLVIALFYYYRKTILKLEYRKFILAGLLLGLVISIPTISVMLTPGFLARAAGLNIFSHVRQLPAGYIEGYQGVLSIFVNNSVFLSSWEFLSLYFSYLSPRNMFNLGDYGPRSSFPDLATFFVWQFPFYLLGLYLFIKDKTLGGLKFLTLTLLLVTPIPAAITRDPYTTIRALPLVIPQLILISYGLIRTFFWVNKKFRILAVLALVILVIYSAINLYSSVIVLNETFRAKEWNFGMEQVAEEIKSSPEIPVIVDNSRQEPYIQLLFFLKYDPNLYQQENFEVPLDQYYTNMSRNRDKKIGKVTTRPINWEVDLLVDQFLVGDELAISTNQISEHKLQLIKEILYPDRLVAFRVVRTNPEYQRMVEEESKNK